MRISCRRKSPEDGRDRRTPIARSLRVASPTAPSGKRLPDAPDTGRAPAECFSRHVCSIARPFRQSPGGFPQVATPHLVAAVDLYEYEHIMRAGARPCVMHERAPNLRAMILHIDRRGWFLTARRLSRGSRHYEQHHDQVKASAQGELRLYFFNNSRTRSCGKALTT